MIEDMVAFLIFLEGLKFGYNIIKDLFKNE